MLLMTKHKEIIDLFYDLVLKKSLHIDLKSISCYLELSNEGKDLAIMTYLYQNKPGLISEITKKLPYFKTPNSILDSKSNQIILVKKFDFSEMSPDIFSLKLLQFHSEVMKYKKEIREIDDQEKVYVKR